MNRLITGILTAAATLGILLAASTAHAQVKVDEIITNAITKRANDKQACTSYTNLSIKNEIKYDGDFNPKEIKTLRMKVYHKDSVETAEILYMDDNSKEVEPKKIREKVADLNKKWREEQADTVKGSRDNFIDPLTKSGREDYDYELLDTRDSSFATIPDTVTATNNGGDQVVIDESVDKVLTYYVVKATSKVEDEKHIDATYWIDAESYGVLHQEFTPAKRPRFVDRLDFQLDYQLVKMNGKDAFLPHRFELKGQAGFLFFKGHFGVIETYSNYKCDPNLKLPSAKRYFYRGDEDQES